MKVLLIQYDGDTAIIEDDGSEFGEGRPVATFSDYKMAIAGCVAMDWQIVNDDQIDCREP